MDDKINKEVLTTTLAAKAVIMIEKLMGLGDHESEKRQLGEFTIYRQGKGREIAYAVTLSAGGLVVIYAERRPNEKAAHKVNKGNYLDHHLPELIDELERLLVLERLSEI